MKKIRKITIFDVANWFLSKESMTLKKLQKLCYYAYSWFIYLKNEQLNDLSNKLFEEKFEAWVHGPVNKELYHKYKKNEFLPINKIENPKLKEKLVNYEDFLLEIWSEYGKYTDDQLESISHQESPWINARNGLASYEATSNTIKDEDIFMEYSGRF